MAEYTLSLEAEADIREISSWTVYKWGLAQAEIYIDGLHAELERLVTEPALGRSFSDKRPGYLRRNYGQHAIFFRREGDGIFVVRMLHSRMDILRRL